MVLKTTNTTYHFDDFLMKFNADFPKKILLNNLSLEYCTASDSPTLANVRKAFEPDATIEWIKIHLVILNDFAGVKQKLDDFQLNELAALILSEFYYLKISELCWFFGKLKAGFFGQFYGVIDAMLIMSYLQEFVKLRAEAVQKIQKIENQKRLEKILQDANKQGITREEFNRRKQMFCEWQKETPSAIRNLNKNPKNF